MKKRFLVLGIFSMTSLILANELTFQFRSNKRVVDTIVKNGKELAEVGELSWALGVQYTVQGSKVTMYLGRKAKITLTGSGGGKFDWIYVDPLLAAKGLGYTIKLEKVTDVKTKVQLDVVSVHYPLKIVCADFIYWQDALKFYVASTNVLSPENAERDPFNLDRSKDGSPCDDLPKLP
jgi:hypothetical protein